MPAPGLGIIGVPTSAGSHHAGQDRAPAALRDAGFVSRLRAAGLDVAGLGDASGVGARAARGCAHRSQPEL